MSTDAVVQQAAALIRAGRGAEGSVLCLRLLEANPRDARALHLLALAARDAGRGAESEQRFRECLALVPGDAGARVDFARLLRELGRLAEAEQQLREALEVAPGFAPAWSALAHLLRVSSRPDDARTCALKLLALAPGDAGAWELLAAVEQQRGALAAAMQACRDGLRVQPRAPRLHYALAQLLREDCRFDEAAIEYREAERCGISVPELYQNWGEAEYESGDVVAALERFREGVRRFPGNAMLHRTCARFHWESDTPGDPLEMLWSAARASPRAADLWQTLVDCLNRLGRRESAREALAEAQASGAAQTPELKLLVAMLSAQDGAQQANRLFEQLAAEHPRNRAVQLEFAEHLLKIQQPERAERVCAQVLHAFPLDQLAWACRGTAWRLLGDERESWLLDYDRMVIPVPVQPPDRHTNREEFFAEIAVVLESLHRMQAHPIEQTLRGGTQTNGFLFRLKHPLLRVLEESIRTSVKQVLDQFPDDPAHPFWGRRSESGAFRFAGAWSVRLRSQGYHTNHIHPAGWISSALYIALPAEVRESANHAGWLQFGVPPVETGLRLDARRLVKPEVGMLTLFPSYMWHGTVPFVSEEPRITVAFDLVPQVSG